ncbi:uncharacterized protein RSE6_06865 [Rhynchosporium secalis]|uniref:Uncharacterized protein n=1 Tax=Rhynchosporium secalis TaxID=38038 RepID=A0A1E1MBG7_RHYSE|nr:uncharacterized protein RSE6_06865 [Rhynchosporium secalis]
MSIVQNIAFAEPPPLQNRQNLMLCLNKQWVENSSSLWPTWTESHIIFLIRKFDLCSISADKITPTLIDTIVLATHIYLDLAGWESTHYDRFWEKTNLKIGYLHASITKMTDRSFADQYCLQRLHAYHQQKVKWTSHAADRRCVQHMSTTFRPPKMSQSHFAPHACPNTGQVSSPTLSDYKKDGLDVWESLAPNDQAKLFQMQIQTSKNFNNLVKIMNQYCKDLRSGAIAWQQAANRSSTKNTATLSTNHIQNALRVQIDLPPSTLSNSRSLEKVDSGGRSGASQPQFSGLPSPMNCLEGGFQSPTTPVSSYFPVEGSDEIDMIRPIQETDKDRLVREHKPADRHIQDQGPLDLKAIFQNKMRELGLKRKRQQGTAEEERMNNTDEKDSKKKRRIPLEIRSP